MGGREYAVQLEDAVELGHAWVQSLADERGIRVLFLRGPALHRHALREARISHDVDVLVEPSRFDELCDAVIASGWTPTSTPSGDRATSHSQVYRHQAWPCTLDMHRYYPGFLYDPATVFDELWARHERMPFAHQLCRVPDRVSSILILALRALRGSEAHTTGHTEELEQLMRVPFTDEERAHAGAVALTTGCTATLDSVLPRLGIHVGPSISDLSAPALPGWRDQLPSATPRTSSWILARRDAPVREKGRALWASLWSRRTR